MKPSFELRSYIPGGTSDLFGKEGRNRYCALAETQPLILYLDADNPRVRLSDVVGGSVGYVAERDTSIVRERIAAGEALLARADGPCFCAFREILIYSEGPSVIGVHKVKRGRVRRRIEGILGGLAPFPVRLFEEEEEKGNHGKGT